MYTKHFIEDDKDDVTAIVTAMTNGERPFLFETLKAIILDKSISQIILCIEEKNDWFFSSMQNFIKDNRLKIIKLPLMNIGAVRNYAIQFTKTPWLAFCDGDDIWLKDKTVLQLKYADQQAADFVGSGHYLTDESGKVCAYGQSIYISMPSTWLVKTELMKRFPFNEALKQGSDGEWWIRTHNQIKKYKYPKILLNYRVRLFSVSSLTKSKRRKLWAIRLAKFPILGKIIYFCTCCSWLLTKNTPYKWMRIWRAN